jgi:hypothetical protein
MALRTARRLTVPTRSRPTALSSASRYSFTALGAAYSTIMDQVRRGEHRWQDTILKSVRQMARRDASLISLGLG